MKRKDYFTNVVIKLCHVHHSFRWKLMDETNCNLWCCVQRVRTERAYKYQHRDMTELTSRTSPIMCKDLVKHRISLLQVHFFQFYCFDKETDKYFLVLYTSKFMFQKPFPDFEIWNPSLKTFLIMTLMAPQVHICMKYSMNLLHLSIAWVTTFTSEDMISLAYDMKFFRRWWAIFNFFCRRAL